MGVHRLPRVLVVVLCAALLTGCAADPIPDATPTPSFTSQADAFAAAEATYRAYVDALNQVDLADPETFEAVYAWTTGDFNATERESLTQMHANSWKVGGESVVLAAEPLSNAEDLSILACVDVSGVTLEDATGESKVSPERPPKYAMSVEFTTSATSTGLTITDVTAVESNSCN